MLGLDYSGGRPSGASVRAARYGFVMRYLANGLASGRVNLTASEVADMDANGVAVGLIWESQANRAAAGFSAGQADADYAANRAKAVGRDGQPIYFAVDFDIPDYSPAATSPRAKLGPVGDYFEGVLSVLPRERVGVYGGYWAVRRVLDAGLAEWAWQTAAWSGGQVDPRIHLFQRIGYVTVDGVQCDVNEARQDQFGQQGDTMDPKDIWEYPLDNPHYDANADPASGEGKKTFPAGAYLTVADMTAQEVKASVADLATATRAAFQALTAKVDALTAAIAAQKPGSAGTIHVDGNLTVTTPEG